MSDAYLGGLRIQFISWTSPSTVQVIFSSTYGSDRLHQLYAGRKLIGSTTACAERIITASLIPSDYPQWLQLVAIAPSLAGTDLGDDLPPRPYNAGKITLDTTGWPADSNVIEVTAGLVPSGAVDDANVVARQIVLATEATYTLFTEPMGPSGSWNFEAYGLDDKPPDGNKGDTVSLSATLLTQPMDFAAQTDDSRFLLTASAGTLTASYTFAG